MKFEAERAEREGNYERVAEIRYGRLKALRQAHRAGTGGAGPRYRCPEQPSTHATFPCGKGILPAFRRRLLRPRW